eukprot:TRINITY_DN10189_c0_g1_i2.p3 TRINITY_DN10189_c0_g1~~TRINITY_DN10189_c0_g1_i2.p3  ORF type:complete len:126 (-),score=12.35 TRINITY_DN10189_c0_g1_i2:362-739(-)
MHPHGFRFPFIYLLRLCEIHLPATYDFWLKSLALEIPVVYAATVTIAPTPTIEKAVAQVSTLKAAANYLEPTSTACNSAVSFASNKLSAISVGDHFAYIEKNLGSKLFLSQLTTSLELKLPSSQL